MSRDAVPAETAPELKARLEAERRGSPFLVYRDAEGQQLCTLAGGGLTPEQWAELVPEQDYRSVCPSG